VTIWIRIAAALVFLAPAVATAQTDDGAFPEASFDAAFRKFVGPETEFSPFYSWDAHLGLDLTIVRSGRNAVNFVGIFQSVGTENLGSQISVGGTGYIVAFGYSRRISEHVEASAGIRHLSTHLTRDLDDKDSEQRALGRAIPHGEDLNEYNVLFFSVSRDFPSVLFAPAISVTVDPVNFELDGNLGGYVRPLYVTSRLSLWKRGTTALALETEHEIGNNPYNNFTLRLEMFPRNQPQGRFAVIVAVAPGDGLHVSPNIGGRRDGVALGVTMRFKS
jgi:hypothetical protein